MGKSFWSKFLIYFMIAIVDCNIGNTGSIKNMLKRVGKKSIITSDKSEIEKADKLILPGVGSFDTGMNQLKKLDLVDFLSELVLERKKPILGICLGMQLLTNYSEEGSQKGLGWIDAETIKFQHETLKIPHMGWNTVAKNTNSNIVNSISNNSKFYFVHTYYVKCNIEENKLLMCNYGLDFDAAIISNNIFGVQFHPEKSHIHGMKLLKDFSNI